MPRYKITDNQTGRTIIVSGDSPPTEEEAAQVIATVHESQPPLTPEGQKLQDEYGTSTPGVGQIFSHNLGKATKQAGKDALIQGGILLAGGVVGKGLQMAGKAMKVSRNKAITDAVVKGGKAVYAKGDELGKRIGEFYSSEAGATKVNISKARELLNKIPTSIENQLKSLPEFKAIELTPEGKIIPNARNLQAVRLGLKKVIGENAYSFDKDVRVAVDATKTVRGELKDLIKSSLPEEYATKLSKLDSDYSKFDKLSAEFKRAVFTREGNPVVKPLANLMKTQDPAVLSRLEELNQQVPETIMAMQGAKSYSSALANALARQKALDFAAKAGVGGAIGVGIGNAIGGR